MAKEPTAATPRRLSIPLTDEGQIDMAHMRPSTADALVELIRTDPMIRDTYMEVNHVGDSASLLDGVTEQNVAATLDLLQSANALLVRVLAAKFVKNPVLHDQQGKPLPMVLDQDILTKAFSFTPEQHAELDPRATRIAQKYSSEMPEWLKKNMDLYMFGFMFLNYTAQNAKLCIELQLQRDIKRAQQAFATAKANQPQNPKPDSDKVRPIDKAVNASPVNGQDKNPPPQFVPDQVAPPPEAPIV